MRFSFDEEHNPTLAVHDSPVAAPRAWHGPLTAAQCQRFAESGWTLLPSVLSAAERRAPAGPPTADALKKRLQAPLQSCRDAASAKTPGSNVACEIWVALDGDATFEIAQESVAAKEGDGLILNADVCDEVERSGSESLRQTLERAGLTHAQNAREVNAQLPRL